MNLKSGNIFAALDAKKPKSKPATEKDSSSKKKVEKRKITVEELERKIFGAPLGLSQSNWADDSDDDDDDEPAAHVDDGWSRVPVRQRVIALIAGKTQLKPVLMQGTGGQLPAAVIEAAEETEESEHEEVRAV